MSFDDLSLAPSGLRGLLRGGSFAQSAPEAELTVTGDVATPLSLTLAVE